MTPERIAELRAWAEEEVSNESVHDCCVRWQMGRYCDCGKERATELLDEIERLQREVDGLRKAVGREARALLNRRKHVRDIERALAAAKATATRESRLRDAAKGEIDRMQESSRWRHQMVEEPPNNEPVLAALDDGSIAVCALVRSSPDYAYWSVLRPKGDPTHWRPLPDPPEMTP